MFTIEISIVIKINMNKILKGISIVNLKFFIDLLEYNYIVGIQ